MSVQTWEYKIVTSVADEVELNRLGADGWELTGTGDTLIFKRPGGLDAARFRETVTLGQKQHYYGVWGVGGSKGEPS